MIPIRAPEKSRSPAGSCRLSVPGPPASRLPSLRQTSKKTVPISPLAKASTPEDRGIYLLKIPIVPKISMEAASISIERG